MKNNLITIHPHKNFKFSIICIILIIFYSLIFYRISNIFQFEENDGMYGLLSSIGNSNTIFTTVWLMVIIVVLFMLLWNNYGIESINLNEKKIIFEREIFGLKQSKKMNIESVNKIKFEKILEISNKIGRIRIEDKLDSYSFGFPINNLNGEHIISELNSIIKNCS